MRLFRAPTAIMQTSLSSLSATTLSLIISTTYTSHPTLILHSCYHLMHCVFAPTFSPATIPLPFFFSFSSLVFYHHLYCNYNFCSAIFPLSLNALHSLFLSIFPPHCIALHCIAPCLVSPLLVLSRLVLSCLVLSHLFLSCLVSSGR